MSAEVELVTSVVNGVASFAFFALLGAVIFSMARRVRDYRVAGLPMPGLLKRGLALFVALAVIGGELVILRTLDVQLEMGSVERLIFIVQSDVLLIGALAYYARIELIDLDDEDKP